MLDKRYDHKIFEPKVQQKWAAEQTYSADNNSGPLYTIDTPPPTVSGSLHMGHIFSYTQTDVIARYKRMNGFSVFYPFGFDDNGLPTERYVEKKKKVSAHKLGRSAFIELCLQETHEVEEQFKLLWQQMGLSVDWDLCYSTISVSTRKLAQESFIKLYKKGFIYRKHEPALYCTTCRTSVAQAELDDIEQNSFFNDIVFKDSEGNDLVIGTTRPELLPSCVALLYNPKDERYQHLKGTKATVPLFDFAVPILADDAVVIDKGTGLVMCCTFGDKTDIAWFKKFNFSYKKTIDFDGTCTEIAGQFAGLKVAEARAKIIETLREQGLLLNQRAISHAVNVHERCKKEIEYIALEQWFLNILDHKKKLLALADDIAWYPSFMKARYKDWVKNIGWDWCLSRQRFFGIPFPVWHCQDCNQMLFADTSELPIDPQEVACTKVCTTCGSTNTVPDTDVMDTWNTSSITPYILAQLYAPSSTPFAEKVPQFLPMSMRPQAHDIIRTWAFYTIVKSWMHHDIAPWNEIVISGHVLSDANQKLSKSQGGGKLAPETLLEQYPADAIRYWTASGGLGYDVAYSESQLKVGLRLITKLWNAFRFIEEHIATVDPEQMPKHLGVVNEWILHQASDCFKKYKEQFENHEFGAALAVVEPFFWNDFCDNYLELIKNQLFNPQQYDEQQVIATRWTLYTIGLRFLQLYAPYLPHVTELLYESVYKNRLKIASLHQTRFADIQHAYVFDKSVVTMQAINSLAATVRKLKTERMLSLKAPLATLTVYAQDGAVIRALEQEQQMIIGITHAQDLKFNVVASLGESTLQEVDTLWHASVVI
ncbi:MAG TPA: valine--tRNA ligase [Candidatus Babeliales bacterium]|nr:valine--tRNA ligase [Candidatus Babeliales bacterium]